MNWKVRLVVEFMNSNLNRKVTVAEMASLVELSHSHLSNLVKGELGMAPVQYHKMLRLQKARDLLATTVWKIDRVSLEVGYQDHSHFSRDFKAQFGVAPSQQRSHYTKRGA